MAKKQTKEVGNSIKDTINELNKKFGDNTLMMLGDKPQVGLEAIPTGSFGLDIALGIGGVPLGRVVEIYGPESCLDADTFIQYEIRTKDGKRQNHKGGTIERLYNRFNKIPMFGKGSYNRNKTDNSIFFAPCMNEEGRIFMNQIIDVVKTGEKQCYEVTTESGQTIISTLDHKFYTGESFKMLSELTIGDKIMIHNNTRFSVKSYEKLDERKQVYVKNHPIAGTKTIKGKYIGMNRDYGYKRLQLSRAIIEARMNGLNFVLEKITFII
jgi:hypothetical protein